MFPNFQVDFDFRPRIRVVREVGKNGIFSSCGAGREGGSGSVKRCPRSEP